MRVNGALNINIRLVAVGAAAPYFYNGRRNDLEANTKSSASENFDPSLCRGRNATMSSPSGTRPLRPLCVAHQTLAPDPSEPLRSKAVFRPSFSQSGG